MVEVEDLSCLREVQRGLIPDPGCSITDERGTFRAAVSPQASFLALFEGERKVADLKPGDADTKLEDVFAELTTSGAAEGAS